MHKNAIFDPVKYQLEGGEIEDYDYTGKEYIRTLPDEATLQKRRRRYARKIREQWIFGLKVLFLSIIILVESMWETELALVGVPMFITGIVLVFSKKILI